MPYINNRGDLTRHPHKTLSKRGFKEHYSSGGHTIWMEGYARSGYFTEHTEDNTRGDVWIQKRLQSGPPRRQDYWR